MSLMLGISDYWAFVAAVLVFLALPGPGTFALLTATAKGGFRAGAAATGGLIAGDQVLMWLAAVGVAAVLQANEALFKGLQYLGAAYLVWIGVRLLVAKAGGATPIDLKPRRFARQAFLITLMNPKAIVFYMAFFPLFIDAEHHRGVVTFAAMAATIAVVTLAYCLTLCAFASAISEQVRAHRRVSVLLQRAAGVALIGFGLRLAR
jgi:threonine/homoserine/homoserine lactone efflux protein